MKRAVTSQDSFKVCVESYRTESLTSQHLPHGCFHPTVHTVGIAFPRVFTNWRARLYPIFYPSGLATQHMCHLSYAAPFSCKTKTRHRSVIFGYTFKYLSCPPTRISLHPFSQVKQETPERRPQPEIFPLTVIHLTPHPTSRSQAGSDRTRAPGI